MRRSSSRFAPILLIAMFLISTRRSCSAERSLGQDGGREKSTSAFPDNDIAVPRTPNRLEKTLVDGDQPKTTTAAQTKPVDGEENAAPAPSPASAVNVTTNTGSMDHGHGTGIPSAAVSDITTDFPQDSNNINHTNSTTDNTSISNTTVTSSAVDATTTTTTSSNNNKTTTTSIQCAEKCTCPDYDTLSENLVPTLRRTFGSAVDNYTDYVLKQFLIQQFVSTAEPVSSILSRINIALAADVRFGKLTVLLEAARFGVTLCALKANDTFFLDTAVEAELFPQVQYKEAQKKALALARTRDKDTLESVDETIVGEAGQKYEGSRLYNISFRCEKGAKVVITREASLYRYGRWRQVNCEVTTEGLLTTNGTLPLMELSVIGGKAAWLQNITLSMSRSNLQPDGSLNHLSNLSSSDAAGGSLNRTSGDVNMNRGTVFPNVREVSFFNTTFSVQELSDVLSWFQKVTDLTLRNNSLGDFNCSQLLPSPAAWHSLTLTNNGLKSVPACTLRTSLIYLQLHKNDISDITPLQYPRFVPAPRIDLLDLSDNNISDVGIFADMNVTLLRLAGNRISSLHKLSFNRLPELGVLDLSRNQLHTLDPGSFKALVYLQELHLGGNHLQSFDRSVSPMRAPLNMPCKIFLSGNRFSHPPFRADGYDPGNYITVYAADNPYACDCDMTDYVDATANSSLSSRYADRGSVRCQYPASLAGLPADELAFTDSCPVVIDCPSGCTCDLSRNDSVVTVDCSSVEHFRQPSSLPATYPLRLEFQGNGTTETPLSLRDGEYLLRVVSLNVSGRGLTRVPEFTCEALPRAELLDLSFNNLTRWPQCLQTRSNEKWPTLELRLARNPWSCDCAATHMRSWLAEMMEGGAKDGVKVTDAREVWCSTDTQPGVRVAEWDTSDCEVPDYLPWVLSLSVVLGLAVVLGPLLYVYRLKAMVAIHAQFHVRPFERAHRFKEEDHDHEALVLHGPSDLGLGWVANSLIPRVQNTRHRLCIPDRDFFPGSSIAESYATAVERSKATVGLLNLDSVRDDWWLYAFQLARAKNARCPSARLLLVLLEHVEEAELPEEARAFLKTNTYLSVDDKWFWKKLFYYLPDPPKDVL